MSEEMATRAVKVLVENFKRNFPKDGMKAIWSELVKQPEKAIEAAVNSICLNSSYLPAPAMLLEKVKTEAKMMAAKLCDCVVHRVSPFLSIQFILSIRFTNNTKIPQITLYVKVIRIFKSIFAGPRAIEFG